MDNIEHTPLEGNIRGRGSRTKLAEDYPAGMAKELARCLAYDEFSHEEVYAGEDETSALDRMINGEDIENENAHHWPTIEDIIDEGPPAEEQKVEKTIEDEVVNSNKMLRKTCGSRAVDYIARLHKNLGHPSAATLLRMLEEVQATDDVVKAAKGYICKHCYHRAKPSQVPPGCRHQLEELQQSIGGGFSMDSTWKRPSVHPYGGG